MGKRKHKTLILDKDKTVGKSLGSVLKKMELDFVLCETKEQGFQELTNSDFPFSLLMINYCMPDNEIVDFLQQVRTESGDTIKAIVSKDVDADIIIKLINKGLIQRSILQPWDDEKLIITIKKSLSLFKDTLEKKKLIHHAKKQSKNLFQVDQSLSQRAKEHIKRIKKIEEKIVQIKMGSKKSFSVEDFEKRFKKYNILEKGKLKELFEDTLSEVYKEFNNVAQENEFEMPQID